MAVLLVIVKELCIKNRLKKKVRSKQNRPHNEFIPQTKTNAMKLTHSLLSITVAALVTGCGNPLTDDANDAAGTGDTYLAREVVGVHLLTTDYHYNKICNFMEEGFVRSAFNLGTEEVEVVEEGDGCHYQWKNGSLNVMFGGKKPFPSIYHAEYAFDKEFQPQVLTEFDTTTNKPALSGPAPQGTASSAPAIGTTTPAPIGPAVIDSINGTYDVNVKLTLPATATAKGLPVAGVGDKALWDAGTSTLHTLFLNHIVKTTVKTSQSEAVRKAQAIRLTQVIVDKISKAAQ